MEVMRGSGQMWFSIPRPLKRQVVEVAARFGQTQSMVIVRAIEFYFETQLGIAPEEKEALP